MTPLNKVSAGCLSVALALSLWLTCPVALAKESALPTSNFRKYFWGARQAYEERDFKKADRLLRAYGRKGSPSDKLLTQAGCDTKGQVDAFRAALKETRECLSRRPKSRSWRDAEQAKFFILQALRAGDAETLEPYVDCAPADLTRQTTACGDYAHRTPGDLKALALDLHKRSDILKWPAWRRTHDAPTDPQQIRWKLYTSSDEWQPCGMRGTALVSLREDPAGRFRIAGFAASCLPAPP